MDFFWLLVFGFLFLALFRPQALLPFIFWFSVFRFGFFLDPY